MDDAVSSSEARDKAETKEYVNVLDEMEEKVRGSAETKGKVETKEKEKVSIAVAKEKVSHAAAKGGKAFMNLVHMAIPQSPKVCSLPLSLFHSFVFSLTYPSVVSGFVERVNHTLWNKEMAVIYGCSRSVRMKFSTILLRALLFFSAKK